jgi:hypothetical protein
MFGGLVEGMESVIETVQLLLCPEERAIVVVLV